MSPFSLKIVFDKFMTKRIDEEEFVAAASMLDLGMPFSADVLSLHHFPSTEEAKLQDTKMTKGLVDLCRKVDSEAELAKYVEHIIRIDIKGRDEPNSIYHELRFVHELTTP